MSLTDDPEFRAYRAEAQATVREFQGVMFRHQGEFTLGPHRWPCRFSVKDPARAQPDELARLQAFAGVRGLVYTDLRLLKVHLDDAPPFPGATLPWDDGTLEVLEWSQESDFAGLRVGTCVLRRP